MLIEYVNFLGDRTYIGDEKTLDSALSTACDWLKAHGRKMYYFRCWTEPERSVTVMDFGDHSEFVEIHD